MERPATSTVSVKIRNHPISTGIVFDIIGVVFGNYLGSSAHLVKVVRAPGNA
jgi:hypothetical protein